MVSKLMKRTPTKLKKPKTPRRNTKRITTPGKKPTSASVLIASINDSFFTCRRRLVKIFSKIVRLTTPTKRSPRKQGFIKLKKTPKNPNTNLNLFYDDIALDDVVVSNANISKALFFGLPPLEDQERKTIFLDLDETLIHSSPDPPSTKYDFVVNPVIDGEMMTFYVLKRPGLDEFLEKINGIGYEIVIFTAGLREYAKLVVDEIDKKGVISHRLYRDSCRDVDGKYVKDLAMMGRDLWKVVIVDDNPGSFMFQPENAVQIRPFVDDLEDKELGKLGVFFEGCVGVKDFREAVKLVDRQCGGRFQEKDLGIGFKTGSGSGMDLDMGLSLGSGC